MDNNYKKACEKINIARKQMNPIALTCYKMIPGPTGPTGPQGRGLEVLGIYNSLEELE